MRPGLIPLTLIAKYLGQRSSEMTDRIKLDGLPCIEVPGKRRPARKISLLAFHGWLVARSLGKPLTVEQLETELSRCELAMKEKLASAPKRKPKTSDAAQGVPTMKQAA